MSDTVQVSIIIPCHNGAGKIGRCLASLRRLDFPRTDYEVVFVDDCSTDGTFELLQSECARERNWQAERLAENSGSPSRPRNVGVNRARGEYVLFLDCDDEILSDTLKVHLGHARRTGASIVRGTLLADDGKRRVVMNRIDDWKDGLSKQARIEKIIATQSTTNTSLIRRDLLLRNAIRWAEDVRMGEDTLFLADVLVSADVIEYIDHATFVYNKRAAPTPSSTRFYGARELNDHLQVWQAVQKKLQEVGVDFYRLRLHVGLREALTMLIFRNRGDVDEAVFGRFAQFVSEEWSTIETFDYIERYREILRAIRDGNWPLFRSLIRPRMLVAGHDLKFFAPAVPDLEPFFDIRVDEWRGHEVKPNEDSRKLCDWAELIWCEWLTGPALWFATNKRPNQRLVARVHRFELARDFGEKISPAKIDAIEVVSVHFFERLLERFPNLPRSKMRLAPNFVRTAEYRRDWSDKRLHTLGMIGYLPSRKGFHVALAILKQLRRRDRRFRLEVFGKQPEELSWVANDPRESRYFEECRRFISGNGLSDAVAFHGHCDLTAALEEHQVGFVLSVSENEQGFPGPESFHLAVADGFAGGGVSLVLRWAGSEYLWPKDFVFDTPEAIVEHILSFRDAPERFREVSRRGLDFVEERYGMDKFVSSVRSLLLELA